MSNDEEPIKLIIIYNSWLFRSNVNLIAIFSCVLAVAAINERLN